MKYEPPLDRARLIETVREIYGLPVDGLRFIPVGVPSVCYVLTCAGEARYVLKLWPETRVGRAHGARRDVALPLTRALYERDLYRRVPYPLRTRDGMLWATFGGASFAVFPLLLGRPPPLAWPPSLWDEFARTMAAIHCATPALADVLPPRETFAIAFEVDLRHGLAALAKIGRRDRAGVRALREVVWPRREEVVAQLTRLHGLQDVVRRLRGPFVLCHTDMGGDNLLVDEDGRLSLLDWDEVIVAPPEHDLQEARHGDFARFLEVYVGAGGVRALHLEHFAFSLLRRYLHDMTVRLLRVLEETTSLDEEREALEGIEACGFAQWAALDSILAGIATALGQLQA